MILKKEQLLKNAAFEDVVKAGQKKVYPKMNELQSERWEREMD